MSVAGCRIGLQPDPRRRVRDDHHRLDHFLRITSSPVVGRSSPFAACALAQPWPFLSVRAPLPGLGQMLVTVGVRVRAPLASRWSSARRARLGHDHADLSRRAGASAASDRGDSSSWQEESSSLASAIILRISSARASRLHVRRHCASCARRTTSCGISPRAGPPSRLRSPRRPRSSAGCWSQGVGAASSLAPLAPVRSRGLLSVVVRCALQRTPRPRDRRGAARRGRVARGVACRRFLLATRAGGEEASLRHAAHRRRRHAYRRLSLVRRNPYLLSTA